MATRAQQVGRGDVAGGALALLVLALVLGPLLAVLWRAMNGEGADLGLRSADWAAIRFTLLQAALSAGISCLAAIPLARALARRRFVGRAALITLLGAPFLLPVVVAVMGLLALFGRNGWINQGLDWAGLAPLEIYGLGGVVLAHVFLNLPLATRLLLHEWLAIPTERMRLGHALGFQSPDLRRHFETPLLRATLPGAFLVIFLICTTSFAVALILGGGPRASTIELAIYQAFRFDFDLSRAATLGLVQVGICLVAGLLALRFGRATPALGSGLDRPALHWPGDHRGRQIGDTLVIGMAGLFLGLPLGAIVLDGASAVIGLPPSTWRAALRSVLVALASSTLSVGLGLSLALFVSRRVGRIWVEGIGLLSIAISPLVIGTGLFLILYPFANPISLALPITCLSNALIALPFLLRSLIPAARAAELSQGRLADALGLRGIARLRHAILPRLIRPLGFGAGLAAAFSMGDLGVIALFSAPGQETLPLEMYRLFGSYRTNDAQGAAVLLMTLSLGLFWIFDRGGRGVAQT